MADTNAARYCPSRDRDPLAPVEMQIGAEYEAPWVEKVAFLAGGGFIERKRAARDSKARARRHRYVNVTCCMARFSKNPLELHHRELLLASGTRGGFI